MAHLQLTGGMKFQTQCSTALHKAVRNGGTIMIFDELDTSMRRFETSLDQTVLPELYMAVRIDGRNFTKLTKETCRFEAPFDVRFRDAMVDTVRHLMDCGFRAGLR